MKSCLGPQLLYLILKTLKLRQIGCSGFPDIPQAFLSYILIYLRHISGIYQVLAEAYSRPLPAKDWSLCSQHRNNSLIQKNQDHEYIHTPPLYRDVWGICQTYPRHISCLMHISDISRTFFGHISGIYFLYLTIFDIFITDNETFKAFTGSCLLMLDAWEERKWEGS